MALTIFEEIFIPYLTRADLLLFHRRLRSLVAIELKIGEFEAEYAGKMQLYLTTLDEQVKFPEENPSIGIIICKSKDKTYVEYALKQSNVPIGVATYKLSASLKDPLLWIFQRSFLKNHCVSSSYNSRIVL